MVPELGQFLLPRVIVDALVAHDPETTLVSSRDGHEEFGYIVQEICHVLQGSGPRGRGTKRRWLHFSVIK